MDKKEIHYDSPTAAKIVTVTGWQDIHGRFWDKDEHMARYCSCTNRKCSECENNTGSQAPKCSDCYRKQSLEAYNKMPYKEWDGEAVLVMHHTDRYFTDESDIIDFLEDEDEDGLKAEDLCLVICEPNRLWEIDSEIWSDIMPEDSDGDLPKEVEAKMKELNAAIKAAKPISWSAGKFRTSYNYVKDDN